MTLSDNDLFYIAPLAALAFWSLLLFAISRASGWSVFAESYADEDSFDGAKLRLQSIALMRGRFPSNYGGAVTFGADSMALRLSLPFFFRPFHPPLKIPFADIVAEPRRVLLSEGVGITAARAPGAAIFISRAQADWIAAQAAGAFRVAPPPA